MQVPPGDDPACDRHGAYGKTEMRYEIDGREGAEPTVGFDGPVAREEYLRHVAEGTLTDILSKWKVRPRRRLFHSFRHGPTIYRSRTKKKGRSRGFSLSRFVIAARKGAAAIGRPDYLAINGTTVFCSLALLILTASLFLSRLFESNLGKSRDGADWAGAAAAVPRVSTMSDENSSK